MALIRVMKDGKPTTFEVVKFNLGKNKIVATSYRDGRALFMNTRGTLMSSGGFPTINNSYVGWSWGFIIPFARSLNDLGLITKQDLKDTILTVNNYNDLQDKKDNVRNIIRLASELRIKLTKSQLKQLKTIREG